MSVKPKVAVLVGSLRKDSITRKLARDISERAAGSLTCTLVEIGDLPHYNQDLETDTPAAWQRLRTQLTAAEALLFVTPEYNRSIPGALKNAIDVGSRPSGKSVFNGKPAAVISQTPHKLGGFGANHALRQCCVFLNMPLLQQPEAYLSGTAELFDAHGKLQSHETAKFLDKFVQAFAAWIARIRAPAAAQT
jgi:chromate reductase